MAAASQDASPARSVAHDRIVAGRVIAEPRCDEAGWRDWLCKPASGVRDLDPAELDDQRRRLVVVAPHPDDEVLACGGWIVRQARLGADIAIVAVTDGEASHPGDPAWPPTRLAGVRAGESARGLARLLDGSAARRSVARLSVPDGKVAAHAAALGAALRPLLRPTDRVVTTWRLDGHPDHEATGAVVAAVTAELGCTLFEVPVWMWHWSWPGDPRVPWARLRAIRLGPEDRRAKLDALAEHATQLAPQSGDRPPVLDAAIVERAGRDVEFVIRTARIPHDDER